MRKIIFSFLLLAVFSSSSIAAEKDYKICSIAGYFWGTKQDFLQGVASHIKGKQHISLDDPICAAAWKNAVETGENFSSTGKIRNQADRTVIKQAATFQSQVYDAVISNMNYK